MMLEMTPSHPIMYMTEFNMNLAQLPINIRFFSTYIAIIGFLRTIFSLMVTESIGPIIITILFMFKDIATFLTIWGLVLISFTAAFDFSFQDTHMSLE